MLRVVGPIVLIIGVLLVGSGAYEIVAGDPFENEGLMFIRMFGGMPMIFVGMVLTGLGYGGAVARYQANEIAPVGRDTVNYLVDGTKDSMQDAALAIAGGLREGITGQTKTDNEIACAKCGHGNDADAKFCDDCGTPIRASLACLACETENDVSAKFCDNCGRSLKDN